MDGSLSLRRCVGSTEQLQQNSTAAAGETAAVNAAATADTQIVAMLPEELWPSIQALRSETDQASPEERQGCPWIVLHKPFVPLEQLNQAVAHMTQALDGGSPVEVLSEQHPRQP